MRLLFIILVFALFAIPLAHFEYASRSTQSSDSLQEIAKKDIEESSQTSTSTVQKKIADTPAQKAPVKKTVVATAAAAAASASRSTSPPIPSPATSTPTEVSKPQNPRADFVAQVEAEVFRLTNKARATNGLPVLGAEPKLREIAWGHSADMLANDYFAHEDESGCSSSCRATSAGYPWRAIGENIYMMSGYKLTPEKTAQMIVDGWMNSPGHRKNILGESFTVSGVGVVHDGTSVYVTALYANPR